MLEFLSKSAAGMLLLCKFFVFLLGLRKKGDGFDV